MSGNGDASVDDPRSTGFLMYEAEGHSMHDEYAVNQEHLEREVNDFASGVCMLPIGGVDVYWVDRGGLERWMVLSDLPKTGNHSHYRVQC